MAKNVLAVDDEFDDLLAIKQALEKEGFVVIPATNGAKALEMLKSADFDLVLIDILMPTVSGYTLLNMLREITGTKTKMMYISILPEKEVDKDGIDGFIQKPFSANILLKKVKEVLKNKKQELTKKKKRK